MAILGQWSLAELTGNSQFVLVGSTLYVVGNTTTAGQFVILASTNFGMSFTQVASYTFLAGSPPSPSPAATDFDPAVCTDGTSLYIIGTRHNPPTAGQVPGSFGTDDIVWFKFTPAAAGSPPTPNTLIGPVAIVSGLIIGSDYDIVFLPTLAGSPPISTGQTCAVICSFSRDDAWSEQVNTYVISPTGVAGPPSLVISSPARSGQTFDSVFMLVSTLLTAPGSPPTPINTLELYVTSHPKAFSYQDIVFTLGLFTAPVSTQTWSTQTVLTTVPARHVGNDLTVAAGATPAANSRYLSEGFYSQNRSGLSGDILLGFNPDVTNPLDTWSFTQFFGTPSASLVQPSINVMSDGSAIFGYITRDLTRNPAVDGIISVNQLQVLSWSFTSRPDFRNPNPFASWLRGTKSVLPVAANWGFIGESRVAPGTSTFYSGFLVPPVAAISPVAINPAFRNQTFLFDASGSFDLNFNALQFFWAPPFGGLIFPSWQPHTFYPLGTSVVDSFGNVQTVTTAGTSGSSNPFTSNTSVGQTTSEPASGSPPTTLVWTNTGSVLGITLTPTAAGNQANLFIPDSVGPAALIFQVEVAVVDIDVHGNPIHTPPVGAQLAFATVTLPFVPAPTITWPGTSLGSPPIAYSPNPINGVARNSTLTLVPLITPGVVGETLTYQWTQVSGSAVTIGNATGPTLIIQTNGVSVNGEALVFQLAVNDGINAQVTSLVTVNVVPYLFNGFDSFTLGRSNFTENVGFVIEEAIPQVSPYVIQIPNPPVANQFFVDQGVVYTNLSALVLVTTPPIQGQYNLNPITGQYFFSAQDALAGSPPGTFVIINYEIQEPATVAERNVSNLWPPLDNSIFTTNLTAFKRSTVLTGDNRIILVSPNKVSVYGDMFASQSAVLLRQLLIPNPPGSPPHNEHIVDAVHTELDYTLVLSTLANLYRYSSAPLISTDNPDTVINLTNFITLTAPVPPAWAATTAYVLGDQVLDTNGNIQFVVRAGTSGGSQPTWNVFKGGITDDGPAIFWKNIGPPVIFDSIFATNTFGNVRVVALSGPNGCFLMQFNSQLFQVEGFFEISVESGLLYGADNVQWIREANVESLHSGQVLLGTLDSTGHTFESLIDLVHRRVLGTWDASKLRNQYVTTGEILFESESSYVGLPIPPVVSIPIVATDNSVTFTWTVERPDLVNSYQIQQSLDGGPFTNLSFIGSGIVQFFTTTPLTPGHTYSFRVSSAGPDGVSAFSTPVSAYIGTPFPPVIQPIQGVSGPAAGPFVVTVGWTQNSPNAAIVSSYTVQMNTTTTFPAEAHSIPGSTPFTVTVTNPPIIGQTFTDGGVTYANGTAFVAVPANPILGQYSVNSIGVYQFSSADAGASIFIEYTTATAFITVATIQGGLNTSYTAGPLAAGHTYNFQVSATFNGITTAFSGPGFITFPAGAEVAVPAQILPAGIHNTFYFAPIIAGAIANPDVLVTLYGVPPYAWTLASGSLPPGLTLGGNTGVISGTPTTPGTYTFTVSIVDSALPTGYTATSPTLSITIS